VRGNAKTLKSFVRAPLKIFVRGNAQSLKSFVRASTGILVRQGVRNSEKIFSLKP